MISSHAVSPLTVLVLGIDFDGCIFNAAYLQSGSSNRLIESNHMLIEHVIKTIEHGEYGLVIFMVGSSRQSKHIDAINADAVRNQGKTISCYPSLILLCDAVQAKTKIPCLVDGYLLADTYGAVVAGENFENAVKGVMHYPYASFVWDSAKYSIVYGHMHKIASKYPKANIHYHFFDDTFDVLFGLSWFYNRYRFLIPHNLTCRLHEYTGTKLTQYADDYYRLTGNIQGEGIIDKFFHDNIRLMARCCGFDMDNIHPVALRNADISKVLHGEILFNFINERKMLRLDHYQELASEIKKINTHFPQPTQKEQNFLNALKSLSDTLQLDQYIVSIRAFYAIKAILPILRLMSCDNDITYAGVDKRKHLRIFIDSYGLPDDYFGYVKSIASSTVCSFFSQPDPLKLHLYEFANSLKVFLEKNDYTNINVLTHTHYT